jgi:hypothetical protein
MMSDPVGLKSAHLSGATTGTLFTGSFYLKAVNCLGTSTAGMLTFRDGGASGAILLQLDVPGNANNTNNVIIPAPGILFETDCYISMPTGYNVTIVYGK